MKKKLEFSKDIFASKNVVYFDVMYVYVREMCERDVCVVCVLCMCCVCVVLRVCVCVCVSRVCV